MSDQTRLSSPGFLGPASALFAVLCFSVNDITIKSLSDEYALHLIVFVRSLIGLVLLAALMMPWNGGIATLRTRRLKQHLLRGLLVVGANMLFFLGLAALPLATAVAIFFISPLVITIFSVIFLGENVGARRWAAVGIGFIGVLIMMRPGGDSFQPAALLPFTAAFCYAGLHMMTRKMGGTESAVALSFYVQLTFVLAAAVIGLFLGNGRYAGFEDPSLAFFFRAWSWPASSDLLLFVAIGAATSFGGYFISQAYRVSEAAVVAPFEYAAMPVAIFWGVVLFGEWPDALSWVGIMLIVGAGLFVLWRETLSGRGRALKGPKYRR